MRSSSRAAHIKDGQRSPWHRRPSAGPGPWKLLRSQGDPNRPPAGAAPDPGACPPPPRSARSPRPLTDTSPDARVLHTRQDRASTLFICVSGQTLTPPQVTFWEAFLLSRRRRQASAPTASADHVPAQPGAGAGPALPADAGSHSSSREEIYCMPGSPERLAGTCGTQLPDTTLIFPTCQRARAETRTRYGPVCRPLRRKKKGSPALPNLFLVCLSFQQNCRIRKEKHG